MPLQNFVGGNRSFRGDGSFGRLRRAGSGSRFAVIAGLLVAFAGTAANATVLYRNRYDPSVQIGACDWNTACGTGSAISPGGYFGNDFAAQAFSLKKAATITAAGATELVDYNYLDAINWAFYKANGSHGLPAKKLASGSSLLNSTIIGSDDFGDLVVHDYFAISNVSLAAGSYYFAVQGVSADPTLVDNYLAQGVAASGAAESMDGGKTWVKNYASDPRSGYISSVALSLEGNFAASLSLADRVAAVPEPSTWAMMLAGLGVVGLAMRRRKTYSASAAT